MGSGDPVVDRDCYRVYRVPFIPQHRPDSLSCVSSSFWHGLGALQHLAFLHSQDRARGRVRHPQHFAFPGVESNVTQRDSCELDIAMVDDCHPRDNPRGQPRRMAPNLHPITHGKMAGCGSRYLWRNRSADTGLLVVEEHWSAPRRGGTTYSCAVIELHFLRFETKPETSN
jgi:hypothetical protein